MLDSLPYSEEWFTSVFERLKKYCGKQLNQVDFKDYQQLAQVLLLEKDQEQISNGNPIHQLSHSKREMLVGAAKNLWKSLAGVKWIFEVRKLMSSKELQFSKIALLDQKAIDLELTDHALEKGKFEDILSRFQELRAFSREFYEKFGNHEKQLRTLELYQDNLKQLLVDLDLFEEKFRNLLKNHEKGD